jgi:hypothetical protein
LHGWAEGLIAAGFHVLGVDIEDMSRKLGEPLPPEHFSLWLQDVPTLHGSQFKDADLIVGSSPCQEFSYRAMPWKRAKALGPPELGMALFHAQFRIQREASEAAGRHIPLVVENVRGAQPWVGRARWNFGSYYLWGDLPALMPRAVSAAKVPGFRFDGSGGSFQTASVEAHEGRKHHGDWFRDPTTPTRQGGQKGRRYDTDGLKGPGGAHIRDGARSNARLTNPAEGRKGAGAGAGAAWFDQNHCSLPSASPRRKAASAKIAKIPFTLAEWIGRTWLPIEEAA